MGCAQTRPSSSNSPPTGLEKLKQDSGYFPTGAMVGGGVYNRVTATANHGSSTGQWYFEEDRSAPPQVPPPARRYYSGNLNGKGTGAGSSSGGITDKTKSGTTTTTAARSPTTGSGGGGNPKKEFLWKKDEEGDGNDRDGKDDVVDGWPKWLMDHVPMRVLEGLAPKNA